MQLLKPPWIDNEERKAIFSVDFHPDGTKFATGGQGEDSYGRVVIWNLKPVISEEAELDEKVPKILCQLDQHLGCVNSVRWSYSGRMLASAGDDKAIIIWQRSSYGSSAVFGTKVVNVESWRALSTLRGHNGDVLDVAWSPNDVWLASCSVDNCVIVWNTEKWPEQVRTLKGHIGMVKGVTWDPTGRYLASQAADKSLRIWRTSNWTTVKEITEPFLECDGNTTVLRPSWSPDGQYLVSANAMNNGGPTAQIIEREKWKFDKDFVGHRRAITCVRFNPNVLSKIMSGMTRPVQYCCVAIGSRDRSLSIWLTCLQRPLVVIKDVFEDSVLDLAWSKCGKYLMAVSQDGSLAMVSFSKEEIGKKISEEELNAMHVKLFGDSAITTQTNNCNIIENPEFLKAKQKETSHKKARIETSKEEKRVIPSTAPTNKQIEMRTADGRRRITPMFIPPPAQGDCSQPEASFSSSRQEKSKIVVEKVEGIIEPNVTSPTKSQSSQHSTAVTISTAPPAELEGVPPTLSSRIEGHTSDTSPDRLTKKKELNAMPIRHKKKRGRKPLVYSTERPTPVTVAEPAPTGEAVPKIAVPQMLNAASLPQTCSMQIPCSCNENGINDTIVVERDASGQSKQSLHKVIRKNSDKTLWTTYLTSIIIDAKVDDTCGVFACKNASLHLLELSNGFHILPPMQMKGKISSLFIQNKCIVAITVEGSLSIWNYEKRSKVLQTCVRHIVTNRGGVKSVDLKEVQNEVVVVIVLRNGEVFCWNHQLEVWLKLSESLSMVQHINPEYTVINSNGKLGVLSSILANSVTRTKRSGLLMKRDSIDVMQRTTESFLLATLNATEYCGSSFDYYLMFKKLVRFYVNECIESSLRKLFDSLLPSSPPTKTHSIFKIDRSKLLEECLAELLYAKNSMHFQRLHAEYKDQLQIDDDMI